VAEQSPEVSAPAEHFELYIRKVRAEIEAEAKLRRMQDPEIEQQEAVIDRAWAAVAPPGATGPVESMLLGRVEQIAMVDVMVPVGHRPGVREVKRLIRKISYWYFAYIASQVNTFHNALGRYLRSLHARVEALEVAAGTASLDGLIDAVDEPSETVAAALANCVTTPVRAVVLSCGSGRTVEALQNVCSSVYGIEPDAGRLLPGVSRGLDLRVDDPLTHLDVLVPGTIDAVVLQGFIEDMKPDAIARLVEMLKERLAIGGALLVAACDPDRRDVVDRDIRLGYGIAPQTWAHLIDRLGGNATLLPVDDERISAVVVARFS